MSIASFAILMVKKRSIVVKIETILERNRQTNGAGRFQAQGPTLGSIPTRRSLVALRGRHRRQRGSDLSRFGIALR